MSERKETVIWGIIFFGLIFIILKSQKNDYNSLRENGKLTIAKIIGFGRKNSVIWEYTVNGSTVEINERKKNFTGLQKGEHFRVIYDPNNLKNAEISLDKPITNWTSTDTIRKLKFPYGLKSDMVYAGFAYEVNDTKYVRDQLIPPSEKWSERDSFILLVNKNNPKIAYLRKVK